MKTLVVSVAVLALSLPIMAVAQDATKQNDNQTQQNQANAKNNKNMSGKVSSDGKTFTNDADSKKYKVSNPSALQDYEDQHVAVIVAVDPDTGDLHIIQVEVPQQ
jgi:pectin methylesterase-like acyl-CoA thioesterase